MKKGFTLIELLAVIIILAVILVIAVPLVLKVVDNSRLSAYIKNEEMVLRAVDVYVSRNTGALPGEIGSTTEVSISYLVSNGMLTEIINPYNKNEDCTGYVTIMKLSDTEYDYTPHLKCGLDIHNSSDDGLVLHYKFDDFQEPTENLASSYKSRILNFHNQVNYGHEGYGSSPAPEKGDGWYKFHISKIGSNFRIAQFPYIVQPINSTRTYSIEFDFGDTEGYYWRLDGYSGGGSSSGNTSKWNITRTNLNNESGHLALFLCNTSINTNVNDVIYYRYYQVEDKPYATPFTYDTREGVVKDHSGNENYAELNLSTTPRYVENSRSNSGAYKFDGINKTISINNDGINFAEPFSFSIWFKNLEEDSNLNRVRLINKKSSWNISDGYAIQLNSNGEIRVLGSDSIEVTSRVLDKWDNEWHHLVVVFNNSNALVFLDGEQKKSYGTINTPKNNTSILYLGGSLNRYFNGLIDDLRIYNRVLSSEEIKLLYESTK